MGTETYDVYVDDTEATLKVKLNNPLMGTETYFVELLDQSVKKHNVKLNNPH